MLNIFRTARFRVNNDLFVATAIRSLSKDHDSLVFFFLIAGVKQGTSWSMFSHQTEIQRRSISNRNFNHKKINMYSNCVWWLVDCWHGTYHASKSVWFRRKSVSNINVILSAGVCLRFHNYHIRCDCKIINGRKRLKRTLSQATIA